MVINIALNACIFAMEIDVSSNAPKTNTMTKECVVLVMQHARVVQVLEITSASEDATPALLPSSTLIQLSRDVFFHTINVQTDITRTLSVPNRKKSYSHWQGSLFAGNVIQDVTYAPGMVSMNKCARNAKDINVVNSAKMNAQLTIMPMMSKENVSRVILNARTALVQLSETACIAGTTNCLTIQTLSTIKVPSVAPQDALLSTTTLSSINQLLALTASAHHQSHQSSRKRFTVTSRFQFSSSSSLELLLVLIVSDQGTWLRKKR